MISLALPTSDASTFAGQLQWFMYGFGYSSVIASVAFMIRLVKSLGRETPDL
jgi:anti-sigma factor ChrR (cupin superfamily)